jgi:hypothetical protein
MEVGFPLNGSIYVSTVSMRLHRRVTIQGQARVQGPQVFPSNVVQTTSDSVNGGEPT